MKLIHTDEPGVLALVSEDRTRGLTLTRDEMAQAAQALVFGVDNTEEPIQADDPALGIAWIDTGTAVEFLHRLRPDKFKTGERARQRLARAAQQERLPGRLAPSGRWYFRRDDLRKWGLDDMAHKPGPRPRTK